MHFFGNMPPGDEAMDANSQLLIVLATDNQQEAQLLKDDDALLKNDLLASRDVVLKPGGDAVLDMPMEAEAKFVAVVGLFRHPDEVNNGWKWVLSREALEPNKARVLEAGENSLTLLPVKAK